MAILPKILIIDDQFGRSFRDRRNLCALFGIKDITGDDKSPEKLKEPVADAVFCSGQKESGKRIENSIETSLDAVEKGWPSEEGWRWALILLDLRFVSGEFKAGGEPKGRDGDDTFGLVLLESIHRKFPDIPVVVMSGRDREEVIEECRKKGASDFIQRVGYATEGLSPKEVLLQKLLEHGLTGDTRSLQNEKIRLVGLSVPIMKALRDARRAATGAGNILLLGETGTGKELFARYLHDLSPKNKAPYKVFHAFGTAETLQEDDLFGHEKGAFTGATSAKQGIFEAANGGTLFVDELGDIPETLQNKLLRPVEAREVSRQGSNRVIPLDIQIILATNKNLDEFSRTGKFKSDLLNRVKAYTITLPRLSDRKEDIPLIANHLLEILCRENNARWPRRILPETIDMLMDYDWPDNVRGLRNVLERAVKNNKDSELLVPSDIRFESYAETPAPPQVNIPALQIETMGLDALIAAISGFRFPQDYSALQGKLPEIQKAIAGLLSNYLAAAIEVTKKRKPGVAEGALNITGAASCMAGEQLKTPKAADLVKRLLQQDGEGLEALVEQYPILGEAYKDALRLRPKKTMTK